MSVMEARNTSNVEERVRLLDWVLQYRHLKVYAVNFWACSLVWLKRLRAEDRRFKSDLAHYSKEEL
jgi:hypothetical protein